MVAPWLVLTQQKRDRRSLRRIPVAIPTRVQGTDALFLVLRRMRAPLIAIVAIFTIATMGLSLMPGTDAGGDAGRLSLFDAMYVMTYTMTTIGFGELPHPFSYPQRMWMTLSIYMSVIGWTYAITSLFGLLQNQGFREAVAVSRFQRRVRSISEPFLIVAGYGETGRLACRTLDSLGRQFVVIDHDESRLDKLAIDQLQVDAPAIVGDVADPGFLGMAGLGRPNCEGVLALTEDAINLSVVMSVNLLRPEIPVIARAVDPEIATRMADFDPGAVINPYERYGNYLVLALQKPTTYQIVNWLIAPPGTPMHRATEGLADGTWVVAGRGTFAEEVTLDLTRSGLDVRVVDPHVINPDISDAVGMVAGDDSDVMNLAIAAKARLTKPEIWLSVRQTSDKTAKALQAFAADSVFSPSELASREAMARIVAPAFWDFIEYALRQSETWAEDLRDDLIDAVGTESPSIWTLDLSPEAAPALVRALAHRPIHLADILRDPADRDRTLSIAPLVLLRAGSEDSDEESTTVLPDPQTRLRVGDRIVLAGTDPALNNLAVALLYDSSVHYMVTGENLPDTSVGRALHRLWRILRVRRLARQHNR